jgi:hypothetical protein
MGAWTLAIDDFRFSIGRKQDANSGLILSPRVNLRKYGFAGKTDLVGRICPRSLHKPFVETPVRGAVGRGGKNHLVFRVLDAASMGSLTLLAPFAKLVIISSPPQHNLLPGETHDANRASSCSFVHPSISRSSTFCPTTQTSPAGQG